MDTEVLREVNRIRHARSLRPLRFDQRLRQAARDHSAEQMQHGYMGHGSPDPARDELGERVKLVGYRGRAYGEVVAWGYRDCRAVVEGWMNSPPHRAVLLDRDMTEVGFSQAGLYWTGNFGAPDARYRQPLATTARPRTEPAPRTYTATPAPQAQPRDARPAPRSAPAPQTFQLQPPASTGFG